MVTPGSRGRKTHGTPLPDTPESASGICRPVPALCASSRESDLSISPYPTPPERVTISPDGPRSAQFAVPVAPSRHYPFHMMTGALPSLVAGVVLLGTVLLQTAPRASAIPAASPDTARVALLTRADLGRIRGRATAPVWVVVISDFQCPFCKRWHEETAPEIERNYVRTGKVRIAYLNYPINTHRNAQPAHELAMCAAEQEKFWPVADALFATQSDWKSRLDVVSYFDSLASTLPLDQPRLRACLSGGRTRELIRADHQRSIAVGVGSTPSFLVGGAPLVGAQPYQAFAQAIEAAIARQRTAPR